MSDQVEPTRVNTCPTCGVDAARAMVVSACVAFYRPDWPCPVCNIVFTNLQNAADHMSGHEPDIVKYVRRWITQL